MTRAIRLSVADKAGLERRKRRSKPVITVIRIIEDCILDLRVD